MTDDLITRANAECALLRRLSGPTNHSALIILELIAALRVAEERNELLARQLANEKVALEAAIAKVEALTTTNTWLFNMNTNNFNEIQRLRNELFNLKDGK